MTRKQVGAAVGAVVLALVASLLTLGLVRDAGDVEAQPAVKWLQWPDDSPWGLDVGALLPEEFPLVLADDFQCTESGLITEIDFWASWLYDELPFGDPALVEFTLSLHSDVPAGPSYSHPGELLWMYTFGPYECWPELWAMGLEEGWFDPFLGYYAPFADSQIWLYMCPIPEPYWFQQEEGKVYWLDIQARPIELGFSFGWKTSIDHWNDDGVWAEGPEPVDPLAWWELRYPAGHPLAGESIDLAFQIWGEECPAGVDTDLDGFNDDVECYLPTDRSDNCPDFVGDDAWPLDMDMNKLINLGGDVVKYFGNINCDTAVPACRRLDLNANGVVNLGGDVAKYFGAVGVLSCDGD